MNEIIISLLIILFLCGVLFLIYLGVKRKIQKVSQQILGSADIIKELKNIEEETKNTPLSISGGDSIYLPRVLQDFPDYHASVMESRIQGFIVGYFSCLENKNLKGLETITIVENVLNRIQIEIEDLKSQQKSFSYDNYKFHAIAISGYEKTKEYATVKYQTAFEYLTNMKTQTKYEVSITYMLKDASIESMAIRCQQCGAPLNHEAIACDYCGAAIVRNIEKTWKITDFKQLI